MFCLSMQPIKRRQHAANFDYGFTIGKPKTYWAACKIFFKDN